MVRGDEIQIENSRVCIPGPRRSTNISVNVHDPPAPDFRLLESTDTDEASVVLKIGDVAIFAPNVEWLHALASVTTSALRQHRSRQLEKQNLLGPMSNESPVEAREIPMKDWDNAESEWHETREGGLPE